MRNDEQKGGEDSIQRNRHVSGSILTFDSFQKAIALPYVGRQTELVVILPKKEGEESLSRVVELLTKEGQQEMSGFAEREGTVEMPKFKFKFEKHLDSDLQQMGNVHCMGHS